VYTAAIAEATIACTGTLGPDSFDAESGTLRRKFETCPAAKEEKVALQDVDDLLGLQSFPGQSQLRQCFAEPWKAWRQRFLESGNRTCPTWERDGSVGEATKESVARLATALPKLPTKKEMRAGQRIDVPPLIKRDTPFGKKNSYYRVRFGESSPPNQPCASAQSCAALCTEGLGGFFLERKDDLILGDPLWWEDPTNYAPGPDPYLAPEYYHPMSFYGDPPGARFGHRNRVGELCSYFNGWDHALAMLYGPVCVGSACSSICSP
jgi:hypothetical protein